MNESLVPAAKSPAFPSAQTLQNVKRLRDEFNRFMLEHEFAVDEILTKVEVLRREFQHLHKYNPIEHISSRVKSPESLLEKASRKGIEPSLEAIAQPLPILPGLELPVVSFLIPTLFWSYSLPKMILRC